MKKVDSKILIDDPVSNRFKSGDVGTLVENNFDKYAYHVQLTDGRSYYFHKGEVELIRFNKDEEELFSDVPTEVSECH